jgi:hypothetical protein
MCGREIKTHVAKYQCLGEAASIRRFTYIHTIQYIHTHTHTHIHTAELLSLFNAGDETIIPSISPPREGAGNPVHGVPIAMAADLWLKSSPAHVKGVGNSDSTLNTTSTIEHPNFEGRSDEVSSSSIRRSGSQNEENFDLRNSSEDVARGVALTNNIVMYVGQIMRPLARKEAPNTRA